jgi:ankyrin repeat protein
MLLQAGANPNHLDSKGRTPLHKACATGGHESIQVLIKGGANPTIVDQKGETPMTLTLKQGMV